MTKKLIRENADQISAVRNHAAANAGRLNLAQRLAPFTSRNELARLVDDCRRYNETEMRKDKTTAKVMDLAPGAIVVPHELTERTRVLTEALECFPFTRSTTNGFEVDLDAVEREADKFRKYISEDYQFQRLKFMEDLCEVLNGSAIGEISRQRNFADNQFVRYNRRAGKWEPVLEILWSPEQEFKF